jgi:hypothetical protein
VFHTCSQESNDPGSPGSHDVSSRHNSEGLNEEDDDAFDDDTDDADDGNPRTETRPKVPWGPEILGHDWTNAKKDFRYYSDLHT